jgi:C-terminal processing protease CtpA/Prc
VAWEAVFASEPPHRPAAGDPPVVVLTSNATSSAGEQLVVAFQGRPLTRTIGGVTAGSPHSLIALRMTDGAQLRMPTAVPLDRDGTPYSGNVIPDDVAAVTGPGGDAAVDAAADWLEDQPGCS